MTSVNKVTNDILYFQKLCLMMSSKFRAPPPPPPLAAILKRDDFQISEIEPKQVQHIFMQNLCLLNMKLILL